MSEEHTLGKILRKNMLDNKQEYERIGKELSAGITVSKKLVELSVARQEYEASKSLLFKYEAGELKCPFEGCLADAWQLLEDFPYLAELHRMEKHLFDAEEKFGVAAVLRAVIQLLEELRKRLE